MEEEYYTEGKKILNILNKNIEKIITISTFTLTSLGFLYKIIRFYQSLKAEQFYGVPKFYFYDNVALEYLVYVLILILTIMTFFYPNMIKKFFNTKKLNILNSLLYSFFLAFFVFDLSINFCISFIIIKLNIIGYDCLLLISCIIISILTGIIYFFVFRTDLNIYSSNNKQKTYNDELKINYFKKNKTKEKVISLSFAIASIFIIFITIFPIFSSIQFIPENKKKYEIVEDINENFKVIVGYYKDLAICMEGKISHSNGGINLKIVRGEYKLESTKNKKLKYYIFDKIYCENR